MEDFPYKSETPFHLAKGVFVLQYDVIYTIYVIMCDEGEKYLLA